MLKRLLPLLAAARLADPCAAQSHPIADGDAVAALIGEASNCPAAMYPIACAIRQRGSLQGVYGGKNPVVKHASPELRARAAHAWQLALANPHPALATQHCTYFGCPTDAPYFRHTLHLKPVFTVGSVTFYHP